MKNYKLLNNLFGWISFVIAAIVYIMTTESSASFWDCSEFISSAFKLEVGHPPGAPFFMLCANLFTHFTSDVTMVGKMVNIFSALCSAATILFLFWTITHLAKKIACKDGEVPSLAQSIAILGSGMVGALAYAFSDTFWFSAVEGEVYAFSSLFTAVVFWLILKWEEHADEPHSDRWIVLIAYLMGLSIGVHLLNLLAIPAISLVFYYKKFSNTNWKGTFMALLVSFALVGVLMYGLIPGMVHVAGWFELFFVNTLSMPFNTGVLVYCLLVVAAIVWGIYESGHGKNRLRANSSFMVSVILMGAPFIGSSLIIGIILIVALGLFLFMMKEINYRVMNTTLLSMMVMAIGYSSYAVIVIRASANTPMSQNAPKDVFTLESYLNREQYGERPLLYGQTFVADIQREAQGNGCVPVYKEGAATYAREIKKDPNDNDKYIVSGHKSTPVYQPELCMLFPRMYSSAEEMGHVSEYKRWSNFEGTPVTANICGEMKTVMKPTFMENMRFFFSYQLGYMYFRYFMWNYSGRQNDIQGHGEIQNGNVLTGFNFIDKHFVGDQTTLPPDMANNKGRNVYYMLPLLLGILGLAFQIGRGKTGEQTFFVTFMLFFMTGIAIVLYLNQYPNQVRERDYAYAGSFYAFAIWIGLGTYALFKGISRYAPKTISSVIAVVLSLLVPVQMISQTWDDHDRSGRTVCPDFGANYLNSCEPNAIIFTNGDNDTFPLWYLQEVEGVRRDVRVCNLSYLQTDWYIDQMKREAYESQPLPISWTRDQYVQGTRDYAYLLDRINEPLDLKTALEFVKSDDPRMKTIPGYSTKIDYIPSKQLFLPVDSTQVVKSGTLRPEAAGAIAKQIDFNLKSKMALGKQELMILEMLAQNNWQRPMYYAISVGGDQFLGLTKNFAQTGLAYQIIPVNQPGPTIDTDKMYDNMMHKFRFGGIEKPGVYLDEQVMSMSRTLRSMYCKLADALIQKGEKERAKEVLLYCQEKIPVSNVPYNYFAIALGECFYKVGESQKAAEVLEDIMDNTKKTLNWYFNLTDKQMRGAKEDIQFQLAIYKEVLRVYQNFEPERMQQHKDYLSNLQ